MSDEIMQNVTPQNAAPTAPADSEKKPCLYFTAFTEEEKQLFEQARQTEGLADEITLLRLKIVSLVTRESQNIVLLLRALTCLERLCKTNKKVFKKDEKDMTKYHRTLELMFKDQGIPPGLVSAR
jgi:hypothetical protein